MNTYRFYEQGGTHVLGTFDNDTLLGERTFNTKRLEAVEYQGKIDIKDKVTEKYILKEQVYTSILKEDGTTWGNNVTNSVTELNVFLNSIPYNIADLQDIPYPKVNNGYLKFQGGEYDWETLAIPSPPPTNTDGLDEGVTNLYFTEERARDSVSATGSLNYDSETGVFSYTQGDTDTVSEGITNLYYTNDRVDERINLAIGDLTAFLNRYNAEAAANKLLASTDTVIVEKYLTVQADGHGEEITQQTDTPTSGNKIIRKIWHKDVSFEDSDVTTWTLVHTFADDTTYNDTIATFNALLTAATYGSIPFTLAQTWEDATAFTGLLDTYSGAAAAYSLRLLDSTYTGDAIRVRRASDNAEQDIGFVDNELDTSALATFCAGTDGFVKTWYDQSGNGNDATQTTAANQPKIYDSVTGVVTDNGKPAVDFDGVDDALNSSSSVSLPLNNAFALVAKGISTAVDEVLNINNTSGLNVRIQSNNVRVLCTDADQNNVASASNNQFLLYAGRQSSTNTVHGSLNGGAQFADTSLDSGSWNTATGTLHVGARGGTSLQWDGQIQEVIYYDSDKLSDRAGIESNINDFYTIY